MNLIYYIEIINLKTIFCTDLPIKFKYILLDHNTIG